MRLKGGGDDDTGMTRQDSLPPTESQEAAEAFENMVLSEEEEDEWQCEFIKPNGERCQRHNDRILTSDGCFCWQHPTRAAARIRARAGAVRAFLMTDLLSIADNAFQG